MNFLHAKLKAKPGEYGIKFDNFILSGKIKEIKPSACQAIKISITYLCGNECLIAFWNVLIQD